MYCVTHSITFFLPIEYCIVLQCMIKLYMRGDTMQNNKSKVYSLRLPDELRSKLEERAKKEGRTLSNLIVFILQEATNK